MENLDALKPDSESEEAFHAEDNPFAFTVGQLNKMLNPKSLAAFWTLGGLRGIERGLKGNIATGLAIEETAGIQPTSAASGGSQEGESGPGLNHQTVTNRDRLSPARRQRKRKNQQAMEHAPARPVVPDPGDCAGFAGGRVAEKSGGESGSLSPRPADRPLSVLGRFLHFSWMPAMQPLSVYLLLVSSIASRAFAMPLGKGSDVGPSPGIGDPSQALNATAATEQMFQWESHLSIGVPSLAWWLVPQFLGQHEFFYGLALLPSTICYLALAFGQGTLQQAASAGIALMVFIGLFLKHITADWADAKRRSAVCFVLCAALFFAAYVSSRISGDTTSTNCATLFRSPKCAGSFLFGTAILLPSLALMVFALWCMKLTGYCLGGTDGLAEPAIELDERT